MSKYVKEGFEELKDKILIIICIPLLVDISGLILYGKIFNEKFESNINLINFKFGVIGVPPSASYLIDGFPSEFSIYLSTTLNTEFLLTYLIFILIMTFIISGYGSLLVNSQNASIRMFFSDGFKNWNKFFVVYLPNYIFAILYMIESHYKWLALVLYFIYNIVIFYIVPVLIIDYENIAKSYSKSFRMLINNLSKTIGLLFEMSICFLVLNIPVSILVNSFGYVGVYISIIPILTLGIISNRSFIKLYELHKGDINDN
jgi:hypothetical protein